VVSAAQWLLANHSKTSSKSNSSSNKHLETWLTSEIQNLKRIDNFKQAESRVLLHKLRQQRKEKAHKERA